MLGMYSYMSTMKDRTGGGVFCINGTIVLVLYRYCTVPIGSSLRALLNVYQSHSEKHIFFSGKIKVFVGNIKLTYASMR